MRLLWSSGSKSCGQKKRYLKDTILTTVYVFRQ
jgi:hypothetical protein